MQVAHLFCFWEKIKQYHMIGATCTFKIKCTTGFCVFVFLQKLRDFMIYLIYNDLMFFSNKKNTQQIGKGAEIAACNYLQKKGLHLLEKNFYCRWGEIDLIMQEGNTVVFIEVRCRKANAQVTAKESITAQKIKKIRKTAEYYIMSLNEIPDCRFDVIAITHNPDNSRYTIDWLKQAF